MPHNEKTLVLADNSDGVLSPETNHSQHHINNRPPQATLKQILCLWVVGVVYSAFLLHNKFEIEWQVILRWLSLQVAFYNSVFLQCKCSRCTHIRG